jgi:hypothetical protein
MRNRPPATAEGRIGDSATLSVAWSAPGARPRSASAGSPRRPRRGLRGSSEAPPPAIPCLHQTCRCSSPPRPGSCSPRERHSWWAWARRGPAFVRCGCRVQRLRQGQRVPRRRPVPGSSPSRRPHSRRCQCSSDAPSRSSNFRPGTGLTGSSCWSSIAFSSMSSWSAGACEASFPQVPGLAPPVPSGIEEQTSRQPQDEAAVDAELASRWGSRESLRGSRGSSALLHGPSLSDGHHR